MPCLANVLPTHHRSCTAPPGSSSARHRPSDDVVSVSCAPELTSGRPSSSSTSTAAGTAPPKSSTTRPCAESSRPPDLGASASCHRSAPDRSCAGTRTHGCRQPSGARPVIDGAFPSAQEGPCPRRATTPAPSPWKQEGSPCRPPEGAPRSRFGSLGRCPNDAESVRSVTLLAEGHRLSVDVCAEVPLETFAAGEARIPRTWPGWTWASSTLMRSPALRGPWWSRDGPCGPNRACTWPKPRPESGRSLAARPSGASAARAAGASTAPVPRSLRPGTGAVSIRPATRRPATL